ncbi:MAG: hypothetical protein JNL60_07070 [Bacteroidia bacterium]|nr:hypothetical protein [Bacteroidia bacterium]
MKNSRINNLKNRLLTGWTFMRILRLALGVFMTVQAISGSDFLLGMLGLILLLQAFYNVGCCGTYGCDINQSPGKQASVPKSTEDITFEEVK